MPEYNNEKRAILEDELYQEKLDEKGVEFLKIRRTITFDALAGEEIQIQPYRRWRQGDTLYRIAFETFGSYDNWWTIALVNNKPTDAHFNVGDEIFIPVHPSKIKNLIGR